MAVLYGSGSVPSRLGGETWSFVLLILEIILEFEFSVYGLLEQGLLFRVDRE